jgi:hypothetical protein
MSRLLQIAIWVTLGTAGILLVLFVYWLVWPYKTTDFNTPFKVLNSPIKAGEVLQVQIGYCKFTTEIPTLTTHFIDGIAYDAPTRPVLSKDIGCGTIVVLETVPKTIPPGEYTLQRVYHYHPNPIRSIDVVTTTERFIVTK